ncbi:dynein intermediate chain 1, axonemal [Caerostris darwini]|uniref:Dynein intermediate chain 1, axonemal n=1 Tax=Caerostris darwini TaxID=1538125 RepID=A0AAV4W585_9ARAC|nr:dynein intermediate chain 1, axonemal [Caerostris darwini]
MTTLSLNPHDRELFLVGTETGLIHRGSFDDKVCSATYEDHKDKVTFIQWNFLHPRVFLSCSNDYTLQIWDHKERISLCVMQVSVFDLAVDKVEPIGTFTCYTAKQNITLTRLAFHPAKPVILVGDDR